MSETAPSLPGGRINVITINPDALLTVAALGGLVFLPVFGSFGALLFLAAGGALLLRRAQLTIHICLTHWYIIALPTFCLLSAIWSQYPALSLRFGAQLAATIVIAISIASTVSARIFCRTLFGLYSAAMIASMLFGDIRSDTGAWLGIYGSKNALAGAATTYVIICVAQIVGGTASYRYRFLATPGLILGLIMLLMAQSVSALVIVPPSLFILFVVLMLYRMSLLQRLTVFAFASLLAGLAIITMIIHSDAVVALLLETTGKDVTLTGRTELWRIAIDFISQNPILGMGYQAFWVKGHGPAEALWYMFGIESRSGFNFHNTYLSNAVEIGLIGVGLQIVVLYGAAITTGLWALRSHRSEASLLFVLMMMVVMVSFVEVPVFFQFSLRTVIIVSAFVFAVAGLRQPRGMV